MATNAQNTDYPWYTHAWWFVPEAPSPSASSPAGRLVLLRPQTLHFISQACCLRPRLLDGGASIAPRGTLCHGCDRDQSAECVVLHPSAGGPLRTVTAVPDGGGVSLGTGHCETNPDSSGLTAQSSSLGPSAGGCKDTLSTHDQVSSVASELTLVSGTGHQLGPIQCHGLKSAACPMDSS